MARPVEFDYDVVLENAMQQFWKEGFEASSVQKLLDATGINRGTLYNSFGDKDTFFKLCVDRYNGMLKELIDETLGNKSAKPEKALAAFFDAAVSAPPRQRVLGCLLVNSACESIIWDSGIQKLLKDSLNAVRRALLARTRELEKSRSLVRGVNGEKAADLLMNLYIAVKVSARTGKAPKQLAEQVAFTLSSIRKYARRGWPVPLAGPPPWAVAACPEADILPMLSGWHCPGPAVARSSAPMVKKPAKPDC